MKLLLIDDEPICGELARLAIQHEYPDVQLDQSEHCAAAALELIDHAYDAVVLDLNLRGRDGLECLREIRAAWPCIPVVIMTGAWGEERRQECLNAGADGYVLKGAIVELLGLVIMESIEKRKAANRAEVSRQATRQFSEERQEQLRLAKEKLRLARQQNGS